LISASWETEPDTHWETYWTETANGYGVTEGGSSGSPLFNITGQVVGTLTGGGSYCSSPELSDFFGKISYGWQSNGTADSNQLRPWLDPAGTSATHLGGSYNSVIPVARFSADTTTIPIGSTLSFYDLSINNPTGWHWYFEGGSPSEWEEQFPPAIAYNVYGQYTVRLVVTNSYGMDSLVKEGYLNVTALAFPNPTSGKLSILLGSGEHSGLSIQVFNVTGAKVSTNDFGDYSNSSVTLDLSDQPAGLYFITIRTDNTMQIQKVLKI
jgi:PKD repeat protein